MNFRCFWVGCRIVPKSLRNRFPGVGVAVSDDASGGGPSRDRHQELRRWQSSLGRWVARFAIGGKRENRGRKIQRSMQCGPHQRSSRGYHARGFFGAASVSFGCEEGNFVEMRHLTRITLAQSPQRERGSKGSLTS
jgi:hypothetical protein